jgi:hypothetical protein
LRKQLIAFSFSFRRDFGVDEQQRYLLTEAHQFIAVESVVCRQLYFLLRLLQAVRTVAHNPFGYAAKRL